MATKSTKIQADDRVEIVDTRIVDWVGYPKRLKDYEPEARELLKPIFKRLDYYPFGERKFGRLISELCYELGKDDEFGGRNRSIHLKDGPGWLCIGTQFTVENIRLVKEGVRYPATGEYDDYEPAFLDVTKIVRLVKFGGVEYPESHLKLIKKGKYVKATIRY